MPAAPVRGFDEDFSYGFYERMLSAYATEYELLPLRSYTSPGESPRPRMYLRHDVDVCLDAAVDFGRVEAQAGFSATYMFIPTSDLYDIRQPAGGAKLRQLCELGHEVALHFDIATSQIDDPGDQPAVSAKIDEQCDIISDVTGTPVSSVSFHRPLPVFIGGPEHLGSRINAYSAVLMQWYRSDSGGAWRAGNPIPGLPLSPEPVAQLLTHPIWWGEEHERPIDRLEQYFQSRTSAMTPEARQRFDRILSETVPRVQRAGHQINRSKD